MSGAGLPRVDSLRLISIAAATMVAIVFGLLALGSGATSETAFFRGLVSWFVLAPISVVGAAVLRWSLRTPTSIAASVDGSLSRRRDS